MVERSVRWDFRSRGPRALDEYHWSAGTHRRSPGRLRFLDECDRLATPGTVSAVIGLRGGATPEYLLFADGLTGSGWPSDHQGRPIEMSVLGWADRGSLKELMSAFRAVVEVHAGRQMLTPAVLTFNARQVGSFVADPSAWRGWIDEASGHSTVPDNLSDDLASIESELYLIRGKPDLQSNEVRLVGVLSVIVGDAWVRSHPLSIVVGRPSQHDGVSCQKKSQVRPTTRIARTQHAFGKFSRGLGFLAVALAVTVFLVVVLAVL